MREEEESSMDQGKGEESRKELTAGVEEEPMAEAWL